MKEKNRKILILGGIMIIIILLLLGVSGFIKIFGDNSLRKAADSLIYNPTKEEIKEIMHSYGLVDENGNLTLAYNSDNILDEKDVIDIIDELLKNNNVYISADGENDPNATDVNNSTGANSSVTSLNFKGLYNPTLTYNEMDVVHYGGNSYVMINKTPVKNTAPSLTGDSIWALLAVKGECNDDGILKNVKGINLSLSGDFLKITFIGADKNEIISSNVNLNLSKYVTSSSLAKTLNEYVTNTEFSNTLAPYIVNFVDKSTLNNYSTKEVMNNAITNAINELNISNYITTNEMNQAIDNALNDYVTQIYIDNAIDNINESISVINETIENLFENNITNINGDITVINNEIETINENVTNLITNLENIENSVTNLELTVEEIENNLTILETNLQSQIDVINQTMEEITENYVAKLELTNIKNEIDNSINEINNSIEVLETSVENIITKVSDLEVTMNNKYDKSETYSKTEVNELFEHYVTVSDLGLLSDKVTMAEDAINDIEEALENLATKSELNNYVLGSSLAEALDDIATTYATVPRVESLAGRVTATEDEIDSIKIAMQSLATKTELSNYVLFSSLTTILTNYYTRTQIDNMLATVENTTYSNTEVMTGKAWNGKVIYRKSFITDYNIGDLNGLLSGDTKTFSASSYIGVPISNVTNQHLSIRINSWTETSLIGTNAISATGINNLVITGMNTKNGDIYVRNNNLETGTSAQSVRITGWIEYTKP